jgi:hypothetical protein
MNLTIQDSEGNNVKELLTAKHAEKTQQNAERVHGARATQTVRATLRTSGINSERQQIFGTGGKNLATCLRDYDGIFDAYTPFSGQVNAGFDGHNHSRLQNLFLRCGQPGGLMNFQA